MDTYKAVLDNIDARNPNQAKIICAICGAEAINKSGGSCTVCTSHSTNWTAGNFIKSINGVNYNIQTCLYMGPVTPNSDKGYIYNFTDSDKHEISHSKTYSLTCNIPITQTGTAMSVNF